MLISSENVVLVTLQLRFLSFPDWISSTEDAMIDAETDNLNRLSTEKSEFADVHFARVIGDLEASCVHLEDVIRGQAPIVDSIARYAAVDNPVGTVPGWRSDVDASTEVTAWYQCHPSGNRMMACDGDFNDEDAVETSRLRQTDAMELFYKGLWAADFPFQFVSALRLLCGIQCSQAIPTGVHVFIAGWILGCSL